MSTFVPPHLSWFISLSFQLLRAALLQQHFGLPGEPHDMKPKKQCPHGWTEYSKRCFIYVFHAMSWAQNGYWYWIDGTQFRYTNWCPGQPSNSYYEQCLRMNFGAMLTFGLKCWDDAYCTNLLSSVCTKNI
ncbi:ladderlectin-like [Astatotilapia calliptera]|uniref:ladderlectin-like n=1 Tax=Astatotilapia calliptera TaxID=8154 RepID=UPI000E401569|nr:ladderlectin-like [Astatotilapia calliptera]